MIEFDFGFDAQAAGMRPQFAVAAVDVDPHRLENLDAAARRRRRGNTGAIDGLDEWRGAAVHDRNFRTVDLDEHVVDAERIQRGEHVFGGRHGRAILIAEHGCEFGRGDGAEIGGKLAIFLTVNSGSQEYDTGVRFRRMKDDGNRRTGMNTDASNADLLAQGRLPAGLHAPSHAHHLSLLARSQAQPSPPHPEECQGLNQRNLFHTHQTRYEHPDTNIPDDG